MPLSAGALYVVATPIGNLEDVTYRALRVLREADLIAAEDTRITRRLLTHYEITTPMTSYHRHTPPAKVAALVERIRAGEQVALVSEAGMPGISDPGWDLIGRCLAEGVPVVPIPGASAVITALAVSGLDTREFTFIGFPPRVPGKLRRKLRLLAAEGRTVVLFESPYRVLKTLAIIAEVMGDRPLAVARELTKQFEEVFRGTAAEARAHFEAHPPRGEFTLAIAGADSVEDGDTHDDAES